MPPNTDPNPPSLLERGLRAAGYACIGVMGVLLLVFPPAQLGDDLGRALTPIWCAFILTSLPAAIAAAVGRYRAEYALIPWFTGALFLAVLHEWWKIPGGGYTTPAALYDTALIFLLSVRFVTLHQLVKIRLEGDEWTRRPSK